MGKKVDSVIIEILPYDGIKYEAGPFGGTDDFSDEGSLDEEGGIFW
jgi:hypothetical protein